jgi:hypothetical protein
MSVRRLLSALSACLFASVTVAVAQPATEAPPTTDAPAGAPDDADAGSDVQMVEDPPADMDGVDENPDAPRSIGGESVTATAIPEKQKTVGYPIQEAWRPITLPENMSEVSFDPHLRVSSAIAGMDSASASAALHARYGITRQVQLGLTYVLGGMYDDPNTTSDKVGFHPGKAVGVDLTVLLKDWLAVRAAVPVYINPVAVGLQLGAPVRFRLTDKLTVGGLEDLLTLRIYRFAPSMYEDQLNAQGARFEMTNTTQSAGALRLSGYGIFQSTDKLAIIGRIGLTMDDFSATRNAAGYGGMFTSLHGGLQYSPSRNVDLGASVGFDDLSKLGSFAPGAYLAVRI